MEEENKDENDTETERTDKDDRPPISNSMAAFNDKLEDLTQSIGILCIIGNAGGRRIFRDKWPEVADYLFGSELNNYDDEGVDSEEQRLRRSELEDAADIRRIDIKQTLSEVVEKSVDAGSLQFDYVGSVIDKYGAGMSRYLYEDNVIERVRPGILAKFDAKGEDGQEQETEQEPVSVQSSETFVAEQSEMPEQNQDVTGTQQGFDQPVEQNVTQEQEGLQSDEANISGEMVAPVMPQPEQFSEPSEEPYVQSSQVEGTSGESRLSVEEVELLSNKDNVLPEPVVQQEEVVQDIVEPPLPPLPSEEDPLNHVRPIETAMPESVSPEAEIMQEAAFVEEPHVEAPQTEYNVGVAEVMTESASVYTEEPQQEQLEEQTDEAFFAAEQPQMQAETLPQEVNEDVEYDLKTPDLSDPYEAEVAQNVSGVEEMYANGILQKGDLSETEEAQELYQPQIVQPQPQLQPQSQPQSQSYDQVYETVPEPAVIHEPEIAPEILKSEKPAEPAIEPLVHEEITTTESAVLSLEEEVLREDLSQALNNVNDSTETQPVPVEPDPTPVPTQEPEIQSVADMQPKEMVQDMVEPPLPPSPPEEAIYKEAVYEEAVYDVAESPLFPQPETVVKPEAEGQVLQQQTKPSVFAVSGKREQPVSQYAPESVPEPESGPAEVPIKLRPREDRSNVRVEDTEIPEVLKYVSEQEDTKSGGNGNNSDI